MENIKIKRQSQINNGWQFLVKVDEREYEVELEKSYWRKLTQEKIEPADLIHKSFIFLLQKESKESILAKFNLKQISDYFSDYEKEILKN
ncbi:hypothetical protein IID20_02770 [Patescibacteria group bacterium]|nr:hypothetical protein [Patescibacteria group bacterium]